MDRIERSIEEQIQMMEDLIKSIDNLNEAFEGLMKQYEKKVTDAFEEGLYKEVYTNMSEKKLPETRAKVKALIDHIEDVDRKYLLERKKDAEDMLERTKIR